MNYVCIYICIHIYIYIYDKQCALPVITNRPMASLTHALGHICTVPNRTNRTSCAQVHELP